MKKYFKHVAWALVASLMIPALASCENDNIDPADEDQYEEVYKEILSNFVETTILPTYKGLAEAALEMRAANEKLKNDPDADDAVLKEAANAWLKTRVWWEMNEAFLFGPIGENSLDIDGHIDSWPLEIDEITDFLAGIEEALESGVSSPFTGVDAWESDNEVIGFHVTEYLLFREGQPRNIADVTTAERHYLTAATDAMVWDCILAYASWAGEENMSSEMQAVFKENPAVKARLDDNSNYKNYGEKFKAASHHGGVLSSAVAEIASGAVDIAEEVGSVKIADPYERKATELVESWYSWNSLADYQNNIRSIENAYLGGVDDNTRTKVSLSTYIVEVNPTLDTQIKNKIEECITKIKTIGTGGYSFYEVVLNQINESYVDEAIDACLELQALFELVEEELL